VCHLAGQLVERYKATQPDLEITEDEALQVKVAGLCHDLGRGAGGHQPKSLPGLADHFSAFTSNARCAMQGMARSRTSLTTSLSAAPGNARGTTDVDVVLHKLADPFMTSPQRFWT